VAEEKAAEEDGQAKESGPNLSKQPDNTASGTELERSKPNGASSKETEDVDMQEDN